MAALSRGARLAFALGDTGFNFVWASIELYLLFFYTNVLGLPVGWAAAIFFAGAVVDWVSDPVIGALADRTAARTGRMRVWLIAAAPVIGIALALSFAKPFADPALLFWWALGTHLLLRISYSAGNIPYAALTARITTDPGEQARLTGLRMQGAALGGLTAAGVYWSMPGGTEAGRFLAGAGLLGLLMQPFLLLTWRTAEEVVPPRGALRAYDFLRETRALIGLVRDSRALRRLLLIILAAGLTASLLGSSILFLFAQDLNRPDVGYPATLLPALALLVSPPAWVWLRHRMGPAAALAVAALAHAGGLLGLTVATALGAPLAVALACLGIAVVAATGLSVLFWAMVPVAALETGATFGDCEGRVFALATTARKLAQALASPVLALGFWASEAATGRAQTAPALAVTALLCTAAILRLAPDASDSFRRAGCNAAPRRREHGQKEKRR